MHPRRVFDPTVFDVETVEPEAVALFMPAHAIVEAVEFDGPQRRERVAEVFLDFLAESLDTPVVDQIFHACDFAVRSITEVALQLHDRDAQVDDAVGLDVAEWQGHRRERLFCTWRYAEAAADDEVIANN